MNFEAVKLTKLYLYQNFYLCAHTHKIDLFGEDGTYFPLQLACRTQFGKKEKHIKSFLEPDLVNTARAVNLQTHN